MCQNTFSNFTCSCNPNGYTTHINPATGEETCLNINECQLTDAALLDSKCTCDRCICIDTPGSYRCAAACSLMLLASGWQRWCQHSTWHAQ